MKMVRIATVKATGKKYLVQQVSIGKTEADTKVHCWGEVASYRGLGTKHDGTKAFMRPFVDVAEVALTPALVEELFQQMIASRREAGHVITGNGRRLTDHGTPAQIQARREADAAMARSIEESGLGDVLRAVARLRAGR